MYTDSNHSAQTCTVLKIIVSLCIGMLLGYYVHYFCSWKMMYKISTMSSSVKFNWGDKVMVDGQEVETLKWFDDVLTADNIKDNLM